ncbi:type I methionyl aminopeptidase [Candidatus Omnitrophota bacterium]
MPENGIDSIRKAGVIVKECLAFLKGEVKVGVSTKHLEEKAHEFIVSRNAKAAFKGYKGYPASICTSRNNVVVHGIPSAKEILKDGDIVGVDVGVERDGYFADAAKTFTIGKISEDAQKLIDITREALDRGIAKAIRGGRVQDISWAIQSFVESTGCNVVRAFVGHGIGKKIHEEPEVPNFGEPHKGMILENGMALAIEPMVNAGTGDVEIQEDGWTAATREGHTDGK